MTVQPNIEVISLVNPNMGTTKIRDFTRMNPLSFMVSRLLRILKTSLMRYIR